MYQSVHELSFCKKHTLQASSQNQQLYQSPWSPQSSPLPQGEKHTVLAAISTWSAWKCFPAPTALPLRLSFSKYQQNLKAELAVKKSCVLAKRAPLITVYNGSLHSK